MGSSHISHTSVIWNEVIRENVFFYRFDMTQANFFSFLFYTFHPRIRNPHKFLIIWIQHVVQVHILLFIVWPSTFPDFTNTSTLVRHLFLTWSDNVCMYIPKLLLFYFYSVFSYTSCSFEIASVYLNRTTKSYRR